MAACIPFDNANSYRTTALRRVRGKDLSGKVYVVTGGSGTLGKEISLALSSAGGTVVMAGRTMAKLEAARAEVEARNGGEVSGVLECLTIDLLDLGSVKAFAEKLAEVHPSIDVLVNNAGMVPPREFRATPAGVEVTFQANFVSSAVLTEMLLPLLAAGPGGRVVHVSSLSHADASKPINWDVIPSTAATFGGYNKDYAESKWLLTTYSAALNARSEPTGVLSVCADPGVSPDSAMWDEQTAMMRFLARYVFKVFTKSSPQAAGCATHLAVADAADLVGGGYYHSGNLYPPMRPDCTAPANWEKMTAALRDALPDDYKQYAVGTPAPPAAE